MNPAWQTLLQNNGARLSEQDVTDFGDAASELAAARDGTVVVPLSHLGLIRATGDDAADFLHNLTSNDVKKLPLGAAQYSSLNTAKGRALASFLLWHDGSDFLMLLSRDITAAIHKKLSMYVLRSKVKLADESENLVALGLSGPDAAKAVQALGASLPEARFGVTHFPGGAVLRLADQRFVVVIGADQTATAWPTITTLAKPAGSPAWRWLDIRDGLPRVSQATQEEFVLQMINLDLLGGVSFTKGCYPGQEIVARTRYLGKVKRRMFLGHTSEVPAIGTSVYGKETGDQACGTVVDAVPAPDGGSDVLAVIQISAAEAGELRLGATTGANLALQPSPYPLEAAS